QGRCDHHVSVPVLAAKRLTSTTPIVFAATSDPVGSGLVASLARPGGNVTGLSAQSGDIAGKQIELLREVVPELRRSAILKFLAAQQLGPESWGRDAMGRAAMKSHQSANC